MLLQTSEQELIRLGSSDGPAVRAALFEIIQNALSRSYTAANSIVEQHETFRGQGERLVLHELEKLLVSAQGSAARGFTPPLPPTQ